MIISKLVFDCKKGFININRDILFKCVGGLLWTLREQSHSSKTWPSNSQTFKIFIEVTFSYNKGQRSHRKTLIRTSRDPLRSIRECCVKDKRKEYRWWRYKALESKC